MTVYPDQQAVVIPFRPDIENLLGPTLAQRFEHGGEWWLSIPHAIDTVRVLRNHGIDTPGPIQHYYNWAGGTPFQSQRITADMLSLSPRAYVLSEMGVGKTRAILYAYHYLHNQGVGLCNKMLVVCPLSTMVSVWENEIFENFHDLKTVVLFGDAKRRKKLLAQPADVYIVNHDGVQVIAKELEARTDIDVIAVDELAVYRNRQAKRWKTLMPFVRRAKYAWGATGGPTPNEPTDAYGQVRLLTPENASYSYKDFRERVMRQVSAFKWVPRENANEIVTQAMQPQVRFVRAECFDLPETLYSTRDCAMEPAALAAYKKMFDQLSVMVKANQVTAANEGVKLSKLLQLSAGFIYDGSGNAQYIGGVSRIRMVMDLVEEAAHKVIVFAPFRFYVEVLSRALTARYGAGAVGTVHGDVPKKERDLIFQGFQKGTNPRVIVAHPSCMAHGLTLVAADTIIWAAPITSLEIYEQACARITRPGQKHCTHIIHIQSTRAETHIYKRLQRKAKMQSALLEIFQQDTALLGGNLEP